jgi:hypothetical protein
MLVDIFFFSFFLSERTALLTDAASTHAGPGSSSKRKPAAASPGAIFASKGKSDLAGSFALVCRPKHFYKGRAG